LEEGHPHFIKHGQALGIGKLDVSEGRREIKVL
jgi:hypothetical protein